MKPPVKMLLIYIDENDIRGTVPLYEAIVRRLRQMGIAGATVQTGIMGFGRHRNVHHKRLFGISDDKPAIITVIDSEPVLRSVIPEIRSMVNEGLMVLTDAEVIELADEAAE
jgi:PII-like signaling protein